MTERVITGVDGRKYITTEPILNQGSDYERGFIDGMQKQMQSSVDRAVNAMAQPAEALKLALEALEGVLDDSPKVLDASISGGLYEVVQCRDAITAIKAALEAKDEPVVWKWHQAPVKTSWGHEMVVADLAIDKDNTVSVYCERHQTAKVEAMFSPPAQPAVPDAIGPNEDELPAYAAGWNDCRALMLEMRKP